MVHDGDEVKTGQPLLRADLDFIKERVPSIITPVVFTNLSEGKALASRKQDLFK